MTVEEKANEFLDKNIVDLLGSPPDAAYEGFIAGYSEAMRWRDPKDELPETDEMVLIKVQIRYTDTIVKVFPSIGILSECGLTHKMRLVDTHMSNGLIIGWRPIE